MNEQQDEIIFGCGYLLIITIFGLLLVTSLLLIII